VAPTRPGSGDGLTLDVPAAAAGERADRFLARVLDLPRNQIQRWLRDGRVSIAGAQLKPSHALAAGDSLEVIPEVAGSRETLEPEPAELAVLYEDRDLVVLDKPSGLSVHPGAGRSTGTLAHRILARYPETAGVGGPGRPGIVHRLDKDTTGALLVARTAAAYQGLTEAFARRTIRKTYLAIVHGRPKAESGRIDAPIGRHPHRRQMMTVRSGGKAAVSHYRVLALAPAAAMVEIDLETGRTHQIRVHMKHVGHPLVGDPVYGEARGKGLPRDQPAPLRSFRRPALHAWRVALTHPVSGAPLTVEAPVPADLRELWRALGGSEFAPAPER
jgi:23S rRNA pseudouridine1911/1915/1917 synthase